MSIREENIETYDAYLKDHLNEKEKNLFEERLGQELELKTDFEAFKKEVTVIKALGIREEMAALMAGEKKPKTIKFRYWVPLAVAAVLAIVLLALPKKATNPEVLFDEYFQPFPDAVSGRSEKTNMQEVMQLYGNQNYKEAILMLDRLPATDTTRFYSAVSWLALKQPNKSLKKLREIDRQSVFHASVNWYKGLSFLLLNQKDSVRFFLNQVEKTNARFDDSKAIMEQMTN